jgi:methionyl-tRNA formyltransferase
VRVAFLGNDPWSVPSLESLAASEHELILVVTRVPRPAGRKGELRPTAVADAARGHGLPLAEVETVKSDPGLQALRDARPDVLAVVAYGEILPSEVLGLPAVAPVNVHFSLLPVLRGANPVARAILEGHLTTGVTTIRMDEGMDTGPILLQQAEAIRDEDDAGSLGVRLAAVGGDLLVRTLDGLQAGTVEERPQEHTRATTAPRLRPEEEWIDWTAPAEHVWRQVRALAPDPGARTRFRGKTLKVLRAAPTGRTTEPRGTMPGAVLGTTGEGLVVAAGEGAVVLQDFIPEGRRRMPAAAFARGARPEPGERLGGPADDPEA